MNIYYADTTESAFNNFMKAYGMWFAIGFAAIILVVLAVILFISLSKKNKKPEIQMDNNEVLLALGGKDNVIEHFVTGSRLSLKLKDYNSVDVNKLNELGFPSVIKMSNKITLVYEGDLESLAKKLFN